uniref:Uncharacterized protein n=1 Tax=Arundo donax TaxID=35708 RepID=A0A0A9D0B1_ARUDO
MRVARQPRPRPAHAPAKPVLVPHRHAAPGGLLPPPHPRAGLPRRRPGPRRRGVRPLLRRPRRAAVRARPGPPGRLRAARCGAGGVPGAGPAADPVSPPGARPFPGGGGVRVGLRAAAGRGAEAVGHHVAAAAAGAGQPHVPDAGVPRVAVAGARRPAPDVIPPVVAPATARLARPRAPRPPRHADALRRRRLAAVEAQHPGLHPRRVREPHRRVRRRGLLWRQMRARSGPVHAPHAAC